MMRYLNLCPVLIKVSKYFLLLFYIHFEIFVNIADDTSKLALGESLE